MNISKVQASEESITIKVVTENSFPVQYVENGKISGPATKLVKHVLSTAGIKYSIEVLPWARAYYIATHEPNVLIYSLAKTQARTQLFNWLGRIKSLNYYYFGSADKKIDINTPLDVIKQYKVGAIRDSASYQYLKANGFKNITTVVRSPQIFKLFEQKRIDLFPMNKSSFTAICTQQKLKCNEIKPLHKLNIAPIDLYIAFSKSTDPALVERVRAAYEIVAPQHKELIGADITPNSSLDQLQ